jgi:UDP-N-acetylglucosamine/UDP-N-acetylgalactosamine diphosphorylase
VVTSTAPSELIARLGRFSQEHLLRWWDELDDLQRELLVQQIEAADLDMLARLSAAVHSGTSRDADLIDPTVAAEQARRARPPQQVVRLPQSSADEHARAAAARQGRELLASGRVGAVLVAGGQGTRLDFPHPKGMYPIGPVSGSSLFQQLAEQIVARSRQAGAAIPYYIMTSEATHDETVAYFQEHKHFGLNPDDVFFFTQGSLPAIDDQSGRLLLADKGRLSTSPDGHGGLLAALSRAGLLDDMKSRGIEYLYYHQVDNPTAILCDPVFLGFHVQSASEMSTKVVAKRSAEERLGVVVEVDGRTCVIEYSDLPDELARQTDEAGELLLWAGSTAVHIFDRTFLERLVESNFQPPFHLAHKVVPYLDETGTLVKPAAPNAYKFERFIFDCLPEARQALVFEIGRAREFNPVKNHTGNDSPETARQALTSLFTNWLREAGAHVDADAQVEISPLLALDEEQLREHVQPGTKFAGEVYLR